MYILSQFQLISIDCLYTFVYNLIKYTNVYKGVVGMINESHPRGRHVHREGRRRRSPENVEGIEKRDGAKTFRRGRALAFYDMMNRKSNILKKQLETPELQSISPILVGELKAVETLMEEFARLFELYEVEETDQEVISDAKSIDMETL